MYTHDVCTEGGGEGDSQKLTKVSKLALGIEAPEKLADVMCTSLLAAYPTTIKACGRYYSLAGATPLACLFQLQI